ncbi:hypothetical protein HII31_05891 [Pseudocercospora fuligena]|uniref:Uncharacterized protein n=1 Tax=Pseudocercospora fuligena TaxID=685502 RepID=A0A8H6VJJ6_9PEZI|nr:hypothetical protein HII31_05891 [Pseudocercospora fuligena]
MSATTAGRTVLGPLTTTFTPAPSCRIATAQGDYANIGKWTAFGAQTCDGSNSGFTLFDVSSCWPPTSSGAAALNTASAGW